MLGLEWIMTTRSARRYAKVGSRAWARSALFCFGLVALAAGLTACYRPEKLIFETDVRILRGTYEGTVDTRGAPRFLQVSSDGSSVAAAWPTTVELWDTGSGDRLTTITMPDADFPAITGLSMNGSADRVAVIQYGNVLLWDAASGTLLRTFDLEDRLGDCEGCAVERMALSAPGQLLAVAGMLPKVLVLDTATGSTLKEFQTAGEHVRYVEFGADGELFAAASESDGAYHLQVWDTQQGSLVFYRNLSPSSGYPPSFAFTHNGSWFAVGTGDKVYRYSVAGTLSTLDLAGFEDSYLLALSPDGTQVVIYTQEGVGSSQSVVDFATGTSLAQFDTTRQGFGAGWSADGSRLLIAATLVSSADLSVVQDYSIGQLYSLELELHARFVDSSRYSLSGIATIDGGSEITVTGEVHGGLWQKYIRQQIVPPPPPTLDLDFHGHPWQVHAYAASNFVRPGSNYEDHWIGSLVNETEEEHEVDRRFRIWRVD